MALKKFKPVTPSLRFKQLTTREELTKVDGPYKPLTEGELSQYLVSVRNAAVEYGGLLV